MEVSAICEWGPLGAVCHHKAPSQAHGAAEPFWQPSTAGSWAQHGLQRGQGPHALCSPFHEDVGYHTALVSR